LNLSLKRLFKLAPKHPALAMLNRKLADILQVPTSAQTYANTLINDDIRPLPPSRRTWRTKTYISWWSIWVMGLSNFQLGSSLVAVGLSVWQTMIAVILGRIIIAAVAILNGYPGAEWHIGFPVFSRVIWGIRVCRL
jgi:NCS1 family nucleobase:cation symporter-1